jgi:hypothetical protein
MFTHLPKEYAMNKPNRLAMMLCLFLLSVFTGQAAATNYTLWIKGRGANGAVGNYNDFSYWGPAAQATGPNPKAVNWDGYNSIATQNGTVRNALDCFCTGSNWCFIAAYSAGDPMVGYTLANFGGSTRQVKNAAPNGAGVCGNAGGTQTGWNIKWVMVSAGAAGGTELSDAGRWTTGEPLVHDLRTTTVRAMYNHNNTRNVWFYMFAGANGSLSDTMLPGQDDEVVAYHSSGAVSGNNGGAYCNPRDWFCSDLTMSTAPNENGWPKWSNHTITFRDDGEQFGHYLSNNWSGITSVMRVSLQTYAK